VTPGVWLDRFFEHYFSRRPVSATFIGAHEYDGELPDYSASGIAACRREMTALLEQLDSGQV